MLTEFPFVKLSDFKDFLFEAPYGSETMPPLAPAEANVIVPR